MSLAGKRIFITGGSRGIGLAIALRAAQDGALIAIGVRNDKLEKLAVAAAKRIGTVEVNHGDTDCKTPDAVPYIAKTKARRSKKAARS